MTTIDQNIWIERVNKEKAQQLRSKEVAEANSGRTNGDNTTFGTVRTFLRDVQSPQLIKNRLFYMLDSTYTVASNPNTMRDAGELRNAQYTIVDEQLRSQPKMIGQEAMQEEKRKREQLVKRSLHKGPASFISQMNMSRSSTTTFSNAPQAGNTKKPRVLQNVTMVAVNDYTKNISEYLFSPGLRQRPVTAAIRSGESKKSTTSSQAPSYNKTKNKKYDRIEKELVFEKERSIQLKRDIELIRDQMSAIQLSVKSGGSQRK